MVFEDWMPLPHDPLVKVKGVVKKECKVYKSSVAPIKMVFKAKRYP